MEQVGLNEVTSFRYFITPSPHPF